MTESSLIGTVTLRSAAGRWTIAAAVLGSAAAFLQMTVINVALPAIADGLGVGMAGIQWVLNGYLLTLSALMLLGGSLGDIYGTRRIFLIGLLGFGATSILAGLMPNALGLVAVRLIQGVAGAFLVPNSLALLDQSFPDDDRGAAIGLWASWSAVTTAGAPVLGGWLVDAASWRWVFACAAPVAFAAAWITATRVPRTASRSSRGVDVTGALLATIALGGVCVGLISGPARGFGDPLILAALVAAALFAVAFVAVERRVTDPLLPLRLFTSRQFTGANLVTLLVYFALSGQFLFLVLQLQSVLGYSALKAGLALVPISIVMIVLSPTAGRVGQRLGPRLPIGGGALVAAAGLALLAGVDRDSSYWGEILPLVTFFALGLAFIVAPLTAAVLGAVPRDDTGIASAVNNAAARTAGLLAVAALPALAGVGGLESLAGESFSDGYRRAMLISAGLCAGGAILAFVTLSRSARVTTVTHPTPEYACSQRTPLAEPVPETSS